MRVSQREQVVQRMRSIDAVCPILSISLPTLAKDSAKDETDIGGPFAEPPHEVRKPFTPEWDVHPNQISGPNELDQQDCPGI